MSNRTLKLFADSTIQPSYSRSPRYELNDTRRRRICARLNRVLAATIDTAESLEYAYKHAPGSKAMELRRLLDRAHIELRLRSHALTERTIALGGLHVSALPAIARQSCLKPYPLHDLSDDEHALEIADRLGQLAGEVRMAVDECTQLSDPTSVDILTATLDSIHKLRWRIESHSLKLH